MKLCRLPNGKDVEFQSRPETEQFYADIFERQIYTSGGIVLRPGDVVFDVGANIGLFTLFAAQYAGTTIFAFEPAQESFELLQHNVARNGVAANLFNYGLGARPEIREFTYYPQSTGLSSFYGDRDEEYASLEAVFRQSLQKLSAEDRDELAEDMDSVITARLAKQVLSCRIDTLSSVMKQHGVNRIDLLKIDVQKSELDVLRGIDDGDWGKIRQIAMEVQDGNGRFEGVLEVLKERQYEVAVQQDDLYEDSCHYNVYGVRAAQASAA